uniref:Uncharacterized protein n=1 Tax=Onchocerca volvulus TaxID=6282 RepID=A0A8R1TZ55_ONCVO
MDAIISKDSAVERISKFKATVANDASNLSPSDKARENLLSVDQATEWGQLSQSIFIHSNSALSITMDHISSFLLMYISFYGYA